MMKVISAVLVAFAVVNPVGVSAFNTRSSQGGNFPNHVNMDSEMGAGRVGDVPQATWWNSPFPEGQVQPRDVSQYNDRRPYDDRRRYGGNNGWQHQQRPQQDYRSVGQQRQEQNYQPRRDQPRFVDHQPQLQAPRPGFNANANAAWAETSRDGRITNKHDLMRTW